MSIKELEFLKKARKDAFNEYKLDLEIDQADYDEIDEKLIKFRKTWKRNLKRL